MSTYIIFIVYTTGMSWLTAIWKSSGPWAGATWTSPVPLATVTWCPGNIGNVRPSIGWTYFADARALPAMKRSSTHPKNDPGHNVSYLWSMSYTLLVHQLGSLRIHLSTCMYMYMNIGKTEIPYYYLYLCSVTYT